MLICSRYVNYNYWFIGWGVSDFVIEYDDVVKFIVFNGFLFNNNVFIGFFLCCNVFGFEFFDFINVGWFEENVDRFLVVIV